MLLDITASREGARFAVRVQPRASQNAIIGVQDGALRVRLTAPPVEGQANAALQALLAERLGVRKADIVIVAGQTGRLKVVEVVGLAPPQVAHKLGVATS